MEFVAPLMLLTLAGVFCYVWFSLRNFQAKLFNLLADSSFAVLKRMSKVDRIKEKIGWYKVLFGILIVSAMSLLAWLVNNLVALPTWQILCGVAGALFVCGSVVYVHLYALKLIDSLEDL